MPKGHRTDPQVLEQLLRLARDEPAKSAADLAEVFGLQHASVAQILRRHGLRRRRVPDAIRAAAKKVGLGDEDADEVAAKVRNAAKAPGKRHRATRRQHAASSRNGNASADLVLALEVLKLKLVGLLGADETNGIPTRLRLTDAGRRALHILQDVERGSLA